MRIVGTPLEKKSRICALILLAMLLALSVFLEGGSHRAGKTGSQTSVNTKR